MPSKRQIAIRKAKEILMFGPLFLDTETTGLGPDAEIVEIAILDLKGTTVFESLVKPEKKIPSDAVWIHGITNEMVQLAPPWINVWKEMIRVISGRYIGIYNADFDTRMLMQSNQIAGIPWEQPGKVFCIMKLYADYYPYGGGKYQKLENAGKQLGIHLPNSHRAGDDTLLSLEVFKRIAGSSS